MIDMIDMIDVIDMIDMIDMHRHKDIKSNGVESKRVI